MQVDRLQQAVEDMGYPRYPLDGSPSLNVALGGAINRKIEVHSTAITAAALVMQIQAYSDVADRFKINLRFDVPSTSGRIPKGGSDAKG